LSNGWKPCTVKSGNVPGRCKFSSQGRTPATSFLTDPFPVGIQGANIPGLVSAISQSTLLEISASALTEVGLTSVVKSVDSDHLMQTPTNRFMSIST
jgi:hypothetical protein